MFVFKTVVWGTIFLFAALIAGPWLALQFGGSFPPLEIGPARPVGIALIVIGAPVAIYCAALLFISGRSRPAPYDAGGVFIIDGPYRYVRNPFMLGVILALWGEALLIAHVALIAYAAILTWGIHFWVVFFEEPALQERFGEEYTEYKQAVPRWFPQFRRYEPK